MPRKGENIYKRKDGRWEGRYIKDRSPEGKAIYGYLYAASYHEVKKKMVHANRYQGSKSNNKTSSVSKVTFQTITNEWLFVITPHIKESTYIKYSNLLNSYILPQLGNQYIHTLSHGMIEIFCNDLLIKGGSKGTGLSPKTVSDCLVLIRSILQYSAKQGNMPLCNAASITVKRQPKEMRILTRNEQEHLCKYLYEHINARNLGILLSLFAGIRIGEICALKWKDISLTEKTIQVHQTMQRIQNKNSNVNGKTKILISSPKSVCSVRTIPLPDELVNILELNRQSQSSYVLTGLNDKYVEPRTMQNHFHRVLKECKIEKMNYHSLRHTFATRCIELGFDITSLSEILGHASVNITMNRYVHPSMELKRKNMMRLSELIAVK